MPALLSFLIDVPREDLSAVLGADGAPRPCLRDWLALIPGPRSPLGRWHPLEFVLALVSAENCVTLCDLGIFVDQTAGPWNQACRGQQDSGSQRSWHRASKSRLQARFPQYERDIRRPWASHVEVRRRAYTRDRRARCHRQRGAGACLARSIRSADGVRSCPCDAPPGCPFMGSLRHPGLAGWLNV